MNELPQRKTYKKSTIVSGVIPKSTPKDSMYVNNVEFYDAIVERKQQLRAALEAGTEPPPISNYIGDCILKIANNLSKKYQFSGYTWKEEMIGDAVVHCIRYIDSFDPDKSKNPFSYFTQSVYYSFLARIEEEKEASYVKYRSTLESAAFGEASDSPDYGDDFEVDMSELDVSYMGAFVSEFERKQTEKRTAAKTAAKKKSSRPGLFDESE